MKKLLFSALMLSALGTVQAQVSGGLRLGGNLANTSYKEGSETSSTDSKFGFQFGGYFDIEMSDMISISPELVYSQMGGKESFQGESFELNLSYISIPVLVKVKFSDIFNFQAGPQLGLLTGAKVKFDGVSFDAKDGYKSTDFGAALGIGADLPNGLNINLRYYLGLANIDSEGSSDFIENNRAIQFTLGYRLFGN
jgi:hypothetical protein